MGVIGNEKAWRKIWGNKTKPKTHADTKQERRSGKQAGKMVENGPTLCTQSPWLLLEAVSFLFA